MEKIQTPFRKMPPKQKLEHIWEYYKLPIFGIGAGIFLIIYIIYKAVTPDPEAVLNVTLVNANGYQVAEEDTFIRYLKEQGYDLTQETAYINTSLTLDGERGGQATATSMQVLSAMVMVGEIDLLVGDEYTLQVVGSGGGLMPMDQVLTPEQMEKYGDRLCAVENPETGQQQICGVWLGENNLLVQDGYYFEKVLVSVPYTAAHTELAAEMIGYLLEQE